MADRRPRAKRRRVAALLAVALALAMGQDGRALGGQRAALTEPPPGQGQPASAPPLPYRPARGDSIVVFGAHPDDETLGAGGFIHAAVTAGARVTIVTFTNGDGYLEGVDVGFRTLYSTPEKFIEFGRLRQQEALAAGGRLGVPPSRVVFLGYPDRGLAVLWDARWDCAHPYTSPYTRRDLPPYALTFRPGSRYCGRDVLTDVETILRRERPAVIVVHHPADTHRDHWAADAFVTFALEHVALQGEVWALHARVLHYLVHYGAWPLPRTYAPDLPMTPPGALRTARDRWASFPLTEDEEDAKRAALLEYQSQVRLLRTYLLSFVRRNELFDLLGPVFPYAARDDGLPLNSPEAWDRIPPAIQLPASGSLSQAANGSADLTAVSVARAPDHLFLGIRLRRPPIQNLQHRLELRLLYRDGHTARLLMRFQPSGPLTWERQRPGDLAAPPGAAARRVGPRILIALPMEPLGNPASAYLHVITLSPIGMIVDRTPWTLIRLRAVAPASRLWRPDRPTRGTLPTAP